ncbi:MAG: hypothetical protein ACOC8C_00995, partial [Chloroflexota bacterium]
MSEPERDRFPVEPPANVPEIQRGVWLPLSPGDPVAESASRTLWDRPPEVSSWDVARLSGAAYLYREALSGSSVVAKFYAVKTGSSAQKYAVRERDAIRRVQALGMGGGETRAVAPLGVWRGVLFLEYVPGLTLENVIAVRHGQPGRLNQAIGEAARCLAALHVLSRQGDERPDFGSAVRHAREIVEELARHGVLGGYP